MAVLGAMLFANAVMIISFLILILMEGNASLSVANNIITGIRYAGGAVLLELFGEYVFAIIADGEKISTWRTYLLRGSCGLAAFLDFVSIFNGMYFTTVNGFHVRGPLYMVNQVFVLVILLGEFIYILSKIKVIGKEASALAMYGFIPAVSVILQIYVQDYVLMYPAFTLSLLIIYLVSYVNKTNQLNRNNHELQKAVCEIEKAKAAAEKANASKSEFLSSMSHDIRTPLNAIVGMTDMAVENIDNKKQALDNLSVVKTATNHLLSLVNDVLDLSMIESGKIKIAQLDFVLPDLLVEVERIIWPLTKAKNQEFILDAGDEVHEFFIGDQPRLKQIMVNFLSNAVKYTPAGGKIVLAVNQSATDDPETAMLTISCIDNGIGIDKKEQEHIFEPFEREIKTTVNKVEGTGLGLTIVKNIVQSMHGTVSVASEKGVGSTFTAEIPMRLGDEEKMLAKFSEVRNYQTLFVADTQELCNAVSTAYPKEIGVPCDVMTSAEVVDDLFSEKKYDAIICISEVNVVDIIRKLRKKYPNTDIIYGCNLKMLDQEKQILNAGADSVLYRPAFRTTLFEEYQALKLKKNTVSGMDKYLNGKNILVAEDQSINYMIVEHMLKNAGADAWQAENGMEAVDMFMGSVPGRYDLILMDIMMPVMDGYAATKKIRSADRPDAKTIPIIAMTANAFAEDIEKSKAAGMNAHLSKPLDPTVLKDTLLRSLAQKNV
jgi:signal transduction histidine kinase/DNA-binding response OmpR family regulator